MKARHIKKIRKKVKLYKVKISARGFGDFFGSGMRGIIHSFTSEMATSPQRAIVSHTRKHIVEYSKFGKRYLKNSYDERDEKWATFMVVDEDGNANFYS